MAARRLAGAVTDASAVPNLDAAPAAERAALRDHDNAEADVAAHVWSALVARLLAVIVVAVRQCALAPPGTVGGAR